jgi:hypothetical protein
MSPNVATNEVYEFAAGFLGLAGEPALTAPPISFSEGYREEQKWLPKPATS